MPTDIAPSVTATYTAVINRPNDGEYANAAALSALVLPVANRVEYVRSLVESNPWRTARIFEDFKSTLALSTSIDQYRSDEFWNTSGTVLDANISVTDVGSASGTSTDLGVVRFANASGSAVTARFRKAFNICRYAQARRFVARVLTGSIAAGNQLEVGFIRSTAAAPLDTGAPRDAISFVFNPAASPNWRVRTDDGTNQTFLDTGTAVAVDTYYNLDLTHDGAGGLTARVNGGSAVIPVANIPALTLGTSAQWKFAMPNAGANRRWEFDFLYWEMTEAARVF